MTTIQSWQRLGPVLPCLDPTNDAWDREPTAPCVVRAGDELRMYYHGRWIGRPNVHEDVHNRIGFATASVDDPLTWTKSPSNPVLDMGESGDVDWRAAQYPWVLPITETHWHMYYVGWPGEFWDYVPNKQAKKWELTLAESDDGGITWQKTGQRIVEWGGEGRCDENGVGSCCVRKVGDEYWMWHGVISWPIADWYQFGIGLSISTDGGHSFKRHPASPVMCIPPRIPIQTDRIGTICAKPFVEFNDGIFHMWFTCANDLPYRICYAQSRDGIHFRWHPEPVFDVSDSGWDDTMVEYPNILHLGDRTFLFYAGNRNHGIGVAERLS